MEGRQFIYTSYVEWKGEKKGLVSVPEKPGLEVATPPEFGGHKGVLSPEDLFVTSVNACIMSTFLHFVQKSNINLLGYDSRAHGTVEIKKGKLIFTKVSIKPVITVSCDEDVDKAKKFIHDAEENCLISNSVKPEVSIEPQIAIKH